MIFDCSFSGGLVFGLVHTNEAIIESDNGQYQFCTAVILHLGFFNIAILFEETL
jgi:hypothetical protein